MGILGITYVRELRSTRDADRMYRPISTLISLIEAESCLASTTLMLLDWRFSDSDSESDAVAPTTARDAATTVLRRSVARPSQ